MALKVKKNVTLTFIVAEGSFDSPSVKITATLGTLGLWSELNMSLSCFSPSAVFVVPLEYVAVLMQEVMNWERVL